MIWIIIVIVLLAAFGPVLYMIPTRRDRRLARLRERARAQGFVIELHPVRQTDPPAEARVTAGGAVRVPMHKSVGYTLAFPTKLERVASWCVLRDARSVTPATGWLTESGDPESISVLDGLLDRLPEDVVGVELKIRTLTCYWLESAPADEAAVDDLKAQMQQIRSRLEALDTSRAPPPGADAVS